MAIRKFCSTASFVVFVLSLTTGVAEIVRKPNGTEVVVGHSTYLNCSTNSPQEIHWFHTPFGSNQDRSFVYGYNQFYAPYIGRFAIEKNQANGAYNLIIPSVKVEDAGQYECQDQNGQGKKESAQLTVLDTDPVCEPRLETLQIIGTNKCGIEPGQLILSCTVKYHGNEAPKMKWLKTGDKNTISQGVTNQIIDNNLIVYNLTIKGNSTVKDGDSYFCNTTLSATLNDGCKSGKINVKGISADYPTCVASEICKPYVKPYVDAIICIFVIILPTAIAGTVLVLWYRQKNRKQKVLSSENPRSNNAATQEAGTAEERDRLHRSASSLVESKGKGVKEETSEHHQPPPQDSGPDIGLIIKTLENQLKESQESTDRQDKTINDLRKNEESNKALINSLQGKVKDLEQRLYAKENIDYLDKPVLAHTIELSEKKKGKYERSKKKSEEKKDNSINGITVLGTELFVAIKVSQEIEVYDSKTFKCQRLMKIREMTNPLDIASSKDAKCLYIVDQLNKETESKVMRLDPEGKVLNRWLTGGKTGRLSTYGCNVILCLSDKQLINEYTENGELIVTVRLSPAVNLNNPLHAIKVTNTCFVVSHGDFNDELHRVCVVDLEGEIRNECTKWEKSKDTSRVTMKVPICLVEDSERSIIVADTDNKRILLLSSMLKYQRKLIEEKNGLKDSPARLCFDDTQRRLFVAVNKWNYSKDEWEGGRIQIFNVK